MALYFMQILSAVGSLLKRFGDKALPPVEELAQKYFIDMLMKPGRSAEDRWLALLLISDMVEHAPASGKYLSSLLPKFMEFCASDNKDLVNVCCYSLGVVAEKHPQVCVVCRHANVCALTALCQAGSHLCHLPLHACHDLQRALLPPRGPNEHLRTACELLCVLSPAC